VNARVVQLNVTRAAVGGVLPHGLKARFVPVYTAFAGDAGLNKLP
jgi:hypothetical protein